MLTYVILDVAFNCSIGLKLINMKLRNKIIDLWHISRTALATNDTGRHSRMIYIKNELINNNSDLVVGMTAKQIWFAIEDNIN